MSGSDIVIDTNILLYFLGGDKNVAQFLDDYNPIISFVTELEILSAPEISQEGKSLVQDLLKDIKVRSQKKLKLPDAIIASLAITLGLPLVTADKAFKNIESLDLIFYKLPD